MANFNGTTKVNLVTEYDAFKFTGKIIFETVDSSPHYFILYEVCESDTSTKYVLFWEVQSTFEYDPLYAKICKFEDLDELADFVTRTYQIRDVDMYHIFDQLGCLIDDFWGRYIFQTNLATSQNAPRKWIYHQMRSEFFKEKYPNV